MIQVTAIFDVGKTNKKLLLFDERGKVCYERDEKLPEIKDEDGFPCENIQALTDWIEKKWKEVSDDKNFLITGLNFTSYGASLVHLDENDKVVTPLYNYLKPFPEDLAAQFYKAYGEKYSFASLTCSPPMGMLNSGLQLYWLKYRKPELFARIRTTLHLPQYLSYLFTQKKYSEYTSIGCHTAMWNFQEKKYHSWIIEEGLDTLLPEIISEASINVNGIMTGSGLHDSSAALIPYISQCTEPFMLLSTGTWCITLNPFNHEPLTVQDLSQDCLSFLTTDGKSIKASRVLLGKEHDYQVERIALKFNKPVDYYKQIEPGDEKILKHLAKWSVTNNTNIRLIPKFLPGTESELDKPSNAVWDLYPFNTFEEAYIQLMLDLSCRLKSAILLCDTKDAGTLYVDGGFSKNKFFMHLMSNHFPEKKLYSSDIAQATALGAFLNIRQNTRTPFTFYPFHALEIQEALERYYSGTVRNYILKF